MGDNSLDLGVADAALALQIGGGDQTLDLGGLEVLLAVALDLTTDDELADVISLGQTEQLTDVGGTLGSQTAGFLLVSETGDVTLTLSQDGQAADGDVGADDAASDGLTLAGTVATLTEGLHAFLEQQTNTSVGHDTLHHGETLLVVTTGDAEEIALFVIFVFVFFVNCLSFCRFLNFLKIFVE